VSRLSRFHLASGIREFLVSSSPIPSRAGTVPSDTGISRWAKPNGGQRDEVVSASLSPVSRFQRDPFPQPYVMASSKAYALSRDRFRAHSVPAQSRFQPSISPNYAHPG